MTVLVLGASSVFAPSAFAGSRVDLSQDNGRSDVLAPGWEQWRVPETAFASAKFAEATVTLRAANEKLTTQWWKPDFDYPARMASDGVTVAGKLEFVLSGLPADKHSLGAYHSALADLKPARINVAVQGATTSVAPTTRVKHDADAATAFVEFTRGVREGCRRHLHAGSRRERDPQRF